jgi:hypothetical protein
VVKGSTLNKRIETLEGADKKKKVKGGKPNALPLEERLLMALEC